MKIITLKIICKNVINDKLFIKKIYKLPIQKKKKAIALTLFRLGFFEALKGWRRAQKNHLCKICCVCARDIKLGKKVHWYVKV